MFWMPLRFPRSIWLGLLASCLLGQWGGDVRGETRRVAARWTPRLAQEADTLPAPEPEVIFPRRGMRPDDLPLSSELELGGEQPVLPLWSDEATAPKGWGLPLLSGPLQTAWLPVKPTPHISYVHHPGLRKSCCAKAPELQTVLRVCNPQNNCDVLIPVCLPACCGKLVGTSGRRALLGRGIVHYQWSCGFHLKVVFERHEQITVHYHGR